MANRAPHVLIIGGGFGGLAAAKALAHTRVRVTLVDRNNHHTFQPLLYQVATAGLEAPDVGRPLRTELRRQENVEILMAEVTRIDPDARRVRLASGAELEWDYLVLATGSRTAYFGHPEWQQCAPGLKTIADALTLRYAILTAFERAEQARDEDERRASLTFVVVGGGPTGVELAGAIAELARHALRRDFDHIDTTQAHVLLLQSGEHVLKSYPPRLQRRAREQLGSLGVHVRTNARVSGIESAGVRVGDELIPARTVIWTAGVGATPLAKDLGAPLDRKGKVQVTPHLNPPGQPHVFVVGDLLALEQDGAPLPGLAPVAMQSGRYVARAIRRRLEGRPVPAFRYRDKGQLSTIGRSRAVGVLPGGLQISGTLAWLAYLGVHLFYLAGFRNRLSVFLTWAWSYATYGRGARLIPSRPPPPLAPRPGTPIRQRPAPSGAESAAQP